MSRYRFDQIWRFLHVVDSDQANPADKLWKLRPMITFLNRRFKEVYTPDGIFAIDETMVPYKGRLSFLQYLPLKPVKWGIKIWSMCESATGYLYNFQVYTGKDDDARPGLSERVVRALCECIVFRHCKLFIDNFYTGFGLLKWCASSLIYCCGTVRVIRKNLPKEILPKQQKQMAKHEYKVAQERRENMTFVNWKDTKAVTFLSNYHHPEALGTIQRKQKVDQEYRKVDVQVPKVVEDYQSGMGGVDLCDQKIGYYMPKIMSVKWWRRLFFYWLSASVHNAYEMAKSAHRAEVLSLYPHLRHFIEALADGLIGDWRAEKARARGNPQQGGAHVVKELFDKKKVCRVCAQLRPDVPAGNKTTNYGCERCNLPVHKKCAEAHAHLMNE